MRIQSLKTWVSLPTLLAIAPGIALGIVGANPSSASRDLSARTGIQFPGDATPLPNGQNVYFLSAADSAVNLALRHHPRTRALFAEAELARAERSGDRVLPNPEADFTLLKHGDESHWELGVMGDLNGFLLYPWKRGAANTRYQAALSRLASEASEQKSEVRIAWYRAVASAQT